MLPVCVFVCIGACIGLYLILYWSVLDSIGILWVNVLASVLAYIEKTGIYLVCICMYTNRIHANICWYVFACVVIHTNMYPRELTGFFPRIDRIFPSSTSKRYSKG